MVDLREPGVFIRSLLFLRMSFDKRLDVTSVILWWCLLRLFCKGLTVDFEKSPGLGLFKSVKTTLLKLGSTAGLPGGR